MGEKGLRPRWSWTEGGQRAGQAGEELGFGMTGREGQTHAAGGLDHAGGDLDQAQPQGRELGFRQMRCGLGWRRARSASTNRRRCAGPAAPGWPWRTRHDVRSEASWVLCSLIKFSAWPRAQ